MAIYTKMMQQNYSFTMHHAIECTRLIYRFSTFDLPGPICSCWTIDSARWITVYIHIFCYYYTIFTSSFYFFFAYCLKLFVSFPLNTYRTSIWNSLLTCNIILTEKCKNKLTIRRLIRYLESCIVWILFFFKFIIKNLRLHLCITETVILWCKKRWLTNFFRTIKAFFFIIMWFNLII